MNTSGEQAVKPPRTKEFGPEQSVRNVLEWIRVGEFLGFKLDGLSYSSYNITARMCKQPSSVYGKYFAFTGILELLDRAEAESLVKSRGGKIMVNVITGEVDFLVRGTNPGVRLQAAEEIGVTIIDEQAFLEMMK